MIIISESIALGRFKREVTVFFLVKYLWTIFKMYICPVLKIQSQCSAMF